MNDANPSYNGALFAKGRNWGDLQLSQTNINFSGDNKPWFTIPFSSITNVQQASNKNEIALELNVEDDPESAGGDFQLCEMRLYIPDKEESKVEKTEKEGEDEQDNEEEEAPETKEKKKTTAEIVKDNIMKIAKIGNVTDSIAHIPEIQMITPRGKFDVYFMKSFIKIHGQTHNYKIINKNIAKVFLVPKIDGHHHFLIVSLISPINQGNTSYPFLIFQIKDESETSVDLNIPSSWNISLPNPLEGSVKEVFSHLFKSILGIGFVISSSHFTFSKGPFLKCSYKANDGVLYPLEKCWLFVHKPVICINHEDIRQVDCARVHDSNLQQRTFDMNIVTKKDEIQFVGWEKTELDNICTYFLGKSIKLNNIDEKNNIIDMAPTTTSGRRARAPITDAPLELPSDESSVDEDYSFEDEDDEDDSNEENEEDEEQDEKEKEKKKHKHKHKHKDKSGKKKD